MEQFLNNENAPIENDLPETKENFETAEPDIMENAEPVDFADVENTETAEPVIKETEPAQAQAYFTAPSTEYSAVYNKINISEQKPIKEYKPMSKGIKLFAFIIAMIIALSSAAFVGYNLGEKSVFSPQKSSVKSSIDISQKPAKTDEMTVAEVYEKVNKSIVGITVYNLEGQGSQGSGIVFSKDGYIVTNDHIYSEVSAPRFKIYTHDSKEYTAEYVAGDKISDLAVLKIVDTKDTFTPAEFANHDELFYGERVVAIGRPGEATAPSSVTEGIISALDRRIQTTTHYPARVIQTTCAINPGSSGGALVNMYGQITGVTSAKLVSVDYDNVGYAIPTDIVKRIVDELVEFKKVKTRAKLGITYQMINSVTAEINNKDVVGLLIDSVAEDSGLYGKVEKGDIITHINGIKITDADIVLNIIEQSKAGDIIEVTIMTASGSKTEKAELKANVGESSYTKDAIPEKEENGGAFNFPEGE